MKTVTFAVPCYNSGRFMGKCIDSLLIYASDDVEIIISTTARQITRLQ
jgi:glycosyltransferase involved in cell wall biosynthesis